VDRYRIALGKESTEPEEVERNLKHEASSRAQRVPIFEAEREHSGVPCTFETTPYGRTYNGYLNDFNHSLSDNEERNNHHENYASFSLAIETLERVKAKDFCGKEVILKYTTGRRIERKLKVKDVSIAEDVETNISSISFSGKWRE